MSQAEVFTEDSEARITDDNYVLSAHIYWDMVKIQASVHGVQVSMDWTVGDFKEWLAQCAAIIAENEHEQARLHRR